MIQPHQITPPMGADRAREIAATFDLRALPADFLANPFPVYALLRGFPGAEIILAELANGASRTRRGLRPEGRAPIREGGEIFDAAEGGASLGKVCSGGFGPSAGGPIAMAILPADLAEGATVWAELRGKRMAVTLSPLPFHKPSYKR